MLTAFEQRVFYRTIQIIYMRGVYLLLAGLLLSVNVSAMEHITKDIKKDFGASVDCIHTDHESFLSATAYFNQRKG